MARILTILGGILLWIASVYADPTVSPTQGFTEIVLNATNFMIQKPYDKKVYDRYSFIDGVHSMWVFKDDKPHTPESKTGPRTEIRIEGYDYTDGVWQFEGDIYVPRGTSGVCVMQVFGGVQHATSLMLLASNGMLMRYNEQVVATDIYDRWIHVNVIHNSDEGKVYVFVDGEEKVVADDRGRAKHYFKCGVYDGVNASSCVESRWKNIRLWTK